MRTQRAFTLIELLVVIAIIGILSSVLLSALGSSRTKSVDAKIKSQMASLRNATEIYAVANNNAYLAGATCTLGLFASPTGNIAGIITNLTNTSTGVDCEASATEWAVSATLIEGGFWCVDNTGKSRSKNTAGAEYNGLISGSAPAKAGTTATVCN